MRPKGISPIIASVLIILVVVSLASTYTVWSSRVFGQVAEEGEETVSRTTRALFSDFELQGASDQRVFIKNTGSADLSAPALEAFYDDEPIEFSADFDILERDELGTLTLRGLWKFGPGDHGLRITGGSFADSARVEAKPALGARVDWRFEDNIGSTTARDSSGSGNDGTITGATIVSNGKFGQALQINGAGRYARKDWADFTVAAMTVEFWMRAEDVTPAWRDLVGIRGSADQIRFHMSATDASILWYDVCAVFNHVASGVVPQVGTWYHVVGTYDGSVAKVYINGVEKGSRSCTLSYDTSTAFVAGSDTEVLYGQLDEVRMYDRALTPDELYRIEIRS